MENCFLSLKAVFAMIVGFISSFWNRLDGIMMALILFITVDYITGVIVGISQKKFNTSMGFKNILKKIVIFLIVFIADIVDKKLLGATGAIRGIVIAFYIANEGLIILDNAASLGVPYPEKLKRIIKQIRDKEGKKDDKL